MSLLKDIATVYFQPIIAIFRHGSKLLRNSKDGKHEETNLNKCIVL